MKIGDTVQCEVNIKDRGFIKRITGIVNWIDKSPETPDGLCMVTVTAIRVEHPDHPERGANLPFPKSYLECLDVEACKVISEVA